MDLFVTTAKHILRLKIEERVSIYGGWLRMYSITNHTDSRQWVTFRLDVWVRILTYMDPLRDPRYDNDDNDNDKPIKPLLKGKGLLPPLGLARLDS
jgi:hypothetical protein